jgi:hypothetical protein
VKNDYGNHVAHPYVAGDGYPDITISQDDQRYMEAACNATPRLLDEIERLRAVLAGILEADEQVDDCKWAMGVAREIRAARDAIHPASEAPPSDS